MNLLKMYLKLILYKNKTSYLYLILSIIITYISIAVLMVYIDNVLILSTDYTYSSFQYLFLSIRTVFIIAGVSFVASQYYSIMKSGLMNYYILKSLGATKRNIRVLLLIQALLLIFITLPVGLYSGYMLCGIVLKGLSEFTLNSSTREMFSSISPCFTIAAATSCIIFSIGIYLERGINKRSLSNIMSDYPAIDNEI